jgi:hypothetical protein
MAEMMEERVHNAKTKNTIKTQKRICDQDASIIRNIQPVIPVQHHNALSR